MAKIIFEVVFGSPMFDEVLALRDRILRKPLNLIFKLVDIEKEYEQIHLACYDIENQLLGCLSLQVVAKKQIKMRQVAIDTPFQKKGIGRLLVRASEKWALNNDFRKMILHARESAVPFYKKIGYQKVGHSFKEVGITHYAMERILI